MLLLHAQKHVVTIPSRERPAVGTTACLAAAVGPSGSGAQHQIQAGHYTGINVVSATVLCLLVKDH
jgi:hypothetical protein